MSARSRLQWRCCRRGTREMDTLFGRFLEQEYDHLTPEQQQLFEQLLDEPDPDIYAWILGRAEPARPEYRILIRLLQTIHVTDR